MEKYQEQLARQNRGEDCAYCGCASGHYAVCSLLNRAAAVPQGTVEFDKADQAFLKAFYIAGKDNR